MGRKLMRVQMDFNWPLNKTWGGYLNPHYRNCVDCGACAGSGLGPRAKVFRDQWYGMSADEPFDHAAYGVEPVRRDHPGILALAERNVGSASWRLQSEVDRLWRDCYLPQWEHHLIQADVDALVAADRLTGMVKALGRTPTAQEVNDASIGRFLHDSINEWVCTRARCEREGAVLECPACKGSGEIWTSPEAEKLAEEWTPVDPVEGPGYQLWETTSEGSPQSPVFATLDELCAYAAVHCTTFAHFKATAEEWKKMLSPGGVVAVREGNAVFL